MPRALITTLYALPRHELGQFRPRYALDPAVNEDMKERIAEWADVDPEEVEWTELDEGEFLTANGDVLGFAELTYIHIPDDLAPHYFKGRH